MKRRYVSKEEASIKALSKISDALRIAYRHPEINRTDIRKIVACAVNLHGYGNVDLDLNLVVRG